VLREFIFGHEGKKGFPEDSINFVKLGETEAIITASECLIVAFIILS
jgi:hypothetical protein